MTIEQWRSRIIRHADAAPADLKAHPQNWRSHPLAQRAALIQTLDQVGWVQDIIVNETTGHVIDGHLRIELAIERGEASVPVVYVELTPEEELLVLATLDPLAAMAEPDTAALSALLDDILMPAGALGDLLAELAKDAGIVQPPEGKTDPDEVPEQRETDVERGQVYQLGAHRLMCGDATTRDDVDRLMDGRRASLMLTDPPYGVHFGAARKNAIAGDLSQAAIPLSFAVAVEHALDEDARLYICGGSGNWGMYTKLFEHYTQREPKPLIWVKESFVMRPNNYHSQFEIVYFGWLGNGGGLDHWYGDRTHSDVWQIVRDRDHLHSTQKPVELMERAIGNSSPRGGVVYEPFAGSGTTVIAAEHLGRACYAMEISEQYVAVSIERWQNYTGRQAINLETGEPYGGGLPHANSE